MTPRELRRAFTRWDRSTAYYAKPFDPNVERARRLEWFAALDEREASLTHPERDPDS